MAAGFLRFPDSPNFLDNTAVHPESYIIAKKLVDYNLDEIDLEKCADELEVGVLTLKDIIEEKNQDVIQEMNFQKLLQKVKFYQ